MINEYELKITEGGGTTMGQELGVAMHTADTNTEEDSLTEAVTKYAERATRAEANMAEMEAKFEERFAIALHDRATATVLRTNATTVYHQPAYYVDRIFHPATPNVRPTARKYPRPLPTTTATISATIQLSALREQKPTWPKWRQNSKNASRCSP